MKSRTTLILLAAILMAFTSCDKIIMPSGNITQENHSFSNYSEIDISDAFDVSLTFSPTAEGIIIEADDNVHQYIDIKKIDNRLYIGVERNYSLQGPTTLKAYISTDQAISGLYASGASHFKVTDQLVASSANIELSGASRFLGTVDVDRLTIKASGASNINLEGSTNYLNVNASGACHIGGYDLFNKDIDVALSGASNGNFTFDGTMDVIASGASSILYKGDGTLGSQDLSGASTITKAD